MRVYGIDIGSSACVLCADDGELLRNELGGHRTAAAVAASATGRQIGEAAASANVRQRATAVGRLATVPYSALAASAAAKHWPFTHHAARADSGGEYQLPTADAPAPGIALLGALLGRVRATSVKPDPVAEAATAAATEAATEAAAATATATETSASASASAPALAIALPPCATEEEAAFARAALADAAAIGGWRLVATPTSAQAAAKALARKYPRAAAAVPAVADANADATADATADANDADADAANPTAADADADADAIDVLLVDMGAATTSIALARLHAVAAGGNGGGGGGGWRAEVLVERCDGFLGCADFDFLLFDHLAAQVSAKYADVIGPGSRAGFRLLDGCERLRKLLSTLPEASTTVENLVDGTDVPLSLTRDELQEVCEPLYGRLRLLLDEVLAYDGAKPLVSVEAHGGGTRMPSVQAVVSEALAASSAGAALSEARLGAKLDDVSVALGAALIGNAVADGRSTAATAATTGEPAADADADAEAGAAPAGSPASATAVASVPGLLDADELQRLIAKEGELAAADAAFAALGEKRNELEGYILHARSLRAHRKHGSLIDGAQLEPLLDAAEEWLYSDEAEEADLGTLDAKLQQLRQQVSDLTADFTAAVEADRKREEAALEASDAERQREKAAAGDDDDHDTRRLKFGDRMRLVLKNKEEGTELFQGGNFRPAAARYTKALTHASKFVDLSPEQKTEVNSVKLSLHLNLAMCWLKITDAVNNLDQAIRSCNDALEIDDKNVKALYRRATALESKKDYEGARADLQRAAELDPSDKAVPQLMARVEAQIKRQEDKEKKMWSKAFA